VNCEFYKDDAKQKHEKHKSFFLIFEKAKQRMRMRENSTLSVVQINIKTNPCKTIKLNLNKAHQKQNSEH
jgi:hypothetical protein